MEIVYEAESLERYMNTAAEVSPEHPVLIDRFLEGAIEVDCDAVFDGNELFVGGVLEHIEEAGIHSGDSACALPPFTLGNDEVRSVVEHTEVDRARPRCARAHQRPIRGQGRAGLRNRGEPARSRTVPFVSKATGVPLAKVAARVMAGSSLAELRNEGLVPQRSLGHETMQHVAVKEAVMPFERFPGVDTLLGPEMRSTGEVMGIDSNFGIAFAKAEAGAGVRLPSKGTVFISVSNRDKRAVIFPAKRLADLGFHLVATGGTAQVLRRAGVDVDIVEKVSSTSGDASTPNVMDKIGSGEVEFVFNTPLGRGARTDGYFIRTASVEAGVPCVTTMSGMAAAVQAIEEIIGGGLTVRPLQDFLAVMTTVARRGET